MGRAGHDSVTIEAFVSRVTVSSRPLGHVRHVTVMKLRDAAGTHRLSGQALRFLLVGGVATVVDVGVFNVLHYAFGVGPLTAKVGSTLVAGCVAFLGNRQWSFGDQQGRRVGQQAGAFVAVSLVALGLGLVPLAVTRYALGLTGPVAINLSANVVGLGVATALRFYGCRRWVFAPAAAPVSVLPAYEEPARLERAA